MSCPHPGPQGICPRTSGPPGGLPRTGRWENPASELKHAWACAKPDPGFEGGWPSRQTDHVCCPLPAVVFTGSQTKARVLSSWTCGVTGPASTRDCIKEQSLPPGTGPARGAAGGRAAELRSGGGLGSLKSPVRPCAVPLGHLLQRAGPQDRARGPECRPDPTATPQGH